MWFGIEGHSVPIIVEMQNWNQKWLFVKSVKLELEFRAYRYVDPASRTP